MNPTSIPGWDSNPDGIVPGQPPSPSQDRETGEWDGVDESAEIDPMAWARLNPFTKVQK